MNDEFFADAQNRWKLDPAQDKIPIASETGLLRGSEMARWANGRYSRWLRIKEAVD